MMRRSRGPVLRIAVGSLWELKTMNAEVLEVATKAVQKAEREKYQELITAAEAVIYGWEKTMHKGPDQTADAIYRMLDVVEKIKI
jgi:DNA-binding XRE family transcriptional regulator